jgi:hypothetical protein
MVTATIENKQITEFAEHVFDTQKADFVSTLTQRIQKSIDIGTTQIENGESMSFDAFKAKFIKEHMLDGKI